MELVTETVGWIGSAVILVSLAQSQPRRLHRLNIRACLVLITYNTLIGAIPGIGLNSGLILVNLRRLRALPPTTAVGDQSHGKPIAKRRTASRLAQWVPLGAAVRACGKVTLCLP
jgi:hypothetical protein